MIAVIDIGVAILIFFMLSSLYFFPVVSLLFLVIFLTIILKNKISIPLFILALAISLTHLGLNVNGAEVGDIVRYYDYYYKGMDSSYPISFVRFKIYQGYSFLLMSKLGLEAQYYGFASILILFVCLHFFLYLSFKSLNLKVTSFKEVLLFYFVFLAFIPFTVYYSFENAMAFSIFSLAMFFWFSGEKITSIVLGLFSLFVHNATFPMLALLFVSGSRFESRNKLKVMFLYYLIFVLFLVQFNYVSSFDLGFVSRVFEKVNRYLFSFSISDVSPIDVLYNIVSLFIMVLLYLAVDSSLKVNSVLPDFIYRYHSYVRLHIVFSSVFFFIPTLGGRYLQLAIFLFIPYAYYYLVKVKDSRKTILLILISILLVSYSNMYFYRSLRLVEFASGEFFLLNISEVLSCHGCK